MGEGAEDIAGREDSVFGLLAVPVEELTAGDLDELAEGVDDITSSFCSDVSDSDDSVFKDNSAIVLLCSTSDMTFAVSVVMDEALSISSGRFCPLHPTQLATMNADRIAANILIFILFITSVYIRIHPFLKKSSQNPNFLHIHFKSCNFLRFVLSLMQALFICGKHCIVQLPAG